MSQLSLEEQVKLMREANYYIVWALVFLVVAFIAEIISAFRLFTGQTRSGIITLLASIAAYCISNALKRESNHYYRKANLNE